MCLESVNNKRIVCVQIFGGFNYYKCLVINLTLKEFCL